MTRTYIELDDQMIQMIDRAMTLYGTRTKKETVDLALRRLVGAALATEDALALEGSGWPGDLDTWRRARARSCWSRPFGEDAE